jgi:hypothetical protein
MSAGDERAASTRLFLAVAASAVFISVLTATMINVLTQMSDLLGNRCYADFREPWLGELLRTPCLRTSENKPSTHSGE